MDSGGYCRDRRLNRSNGFGRSIGSGGDRPIVRGNNTDVTTMLARYAGSTLGLFAFAIVIVAGLFTQNPMMTTLSRSLFALFAFFLIGFVLGAAAQMVVNEHQTRSA